MVRTTVAETPSIYLFVNDLGNVINQVHNILIKIAKQVREVGDAAEAKEGVDPPSRDSGVKQHHFPVLRPG